jgi:hypothetical protein
MDVVAQPRTHLSSPPDQRHSEITLLVHEQPVALLEHMQREHAAGEEDRVEGKEG